MTTPSTSALARAFARRVREELSPHLLEIVRRNRTPEYKGCCATHDFCDANMLMLDAWSEITGEDPDAWDGDEDMGVVNAAWDLARESEFTL